MEGGGKHIHMLHTFPVATSIARLRGDGVLFLQERLPATNVSVVLSQNWLEKELLSQQSNPRLVRPFCTPSYRYRLRLSISHVFRKPPCDTLQMFPLRLRQHIRVGGILMITHGIVIDH